MSHPPHICIRTDSAAAGDTCPERENQRKRECLHRLEQEYQQVTEQIQALLHKQEQLDTDLKIARGSAESLADQSTAELEQNIADIEETNRKVRANLDKGQGRRGCQGIQGTIQYSYHQN